MVCSHKCISGLCNKDKQLKPNHCEVMQRRLNIGEEEKTLVDIHKLDLQCDHFHLADNIQKSQSHK